MKKILSLGLALVMLFALVGCSGKEMQEKLAELEAKLQEQSIKIDDLEQEKDGLLGQITQLQGEVGGLQSEVERLEQENEETFNYLCAVNSETCSIKTAYENGWLTREQLILIAFRSCAKVYEGSLEEDESMWVELVDTSDVPIGELDKETERKIQGRVAYMERHYASLGFWSGKAEDVRIKYFGTYGDCVLMDYETAPVDIPCPMEYEEIDGIIFYYSSYLPTIWKEINKR